MPASICDPVSSALRLSLTADESQSSSLLDSRLYSSAKSALLSKIEFEESGDYQSNVLDGLKSKYVVIRPKKPVLETKLLKKESISGNQTSGTYLQTMFTLFRCFRFGMSDDKIILEVITSNAVNIYHLLVADILALVARAFVISRIMYALVRSR